MSTTRRTFLTGSVALLAAPHSAWAQHAAKIPSIGFLYHGPPPLPPMFEAFRMGLRDLGWIEGKNLVIHHRFAESTGRLPAAVTEFLRLDVAVIVAPGTST